MALIGVDASVERVNAALAAITGRSAEELAALRHEELLHPDDEELAAEAFASLLADDGMATELRIVHADGHPVWVSLRATIVRDDEGTPVHVLVQVQDITERRSLEDQLRHLADHDALTGLLNRRGIDRALAQHVARGRRYGAEGALLVLDLDGFKAVNDTLGHAAGDELIVTCASALRNRLRETDILGRLGGDEFAVLLPAEGEAEAIIVARGHRHGHPRGQRGHRLGRRDAVRRRADDHQRDGPGRHGDVRRQAGAVATATSSRPARCPRRPEARRARAASLRAHAHRPRDLQGLRHPRPLRRRSSTATAPSRSAARSCACSPTWRARPPASCASASGRDMRLTAPGAERALPRRAWSPRAPTSSTPGWSAPRCSTSSSARAASTAA